jgi:STAS domain
VAEIRYLRRMVEGVPVVAASAKTGITTGEQLHPELGLSLLHDSGPRPGALTISPLPDRTGLVISGEADLTVKDMLHEALAALPANGASDIHLDLSGLRFIDVACTRELIALTSRHPASHVIMHDPPAALLCISALLSPDASIGLAGAPRPLTLAPDQDSPTPGTSADGTSLPSATPQAAQLETDVIDLITTYRAQITELLACTSQLTGSCPDAPGGQAPVAGDRVLSQTWAALACLLAAYIDAEQEVCYLTMTAARPLADLRDAWAADLFDIREALADARLSAVGSARWLLAVTDVSTAVIRHFHTEDHYLLPALAEAPAETRGLLGRQWTAFTIARLLDDAESHAANPGERRFPDHTPGPPPSS